MNKDELAQITGERIQILRKKRNLTQEHLAMHIEVNRSMVANWEGKYRYPTLEQYCLLAEFFNVSVDYLVGREDLNVDDDGGSVECHRLMRKLTGNNYFRKYYIEYLFNSDRFIDLDFLNKAGKKIVTEIYNLAKGAERFTEKENED